MAEKDGSLLREQYRKGEWKNRKITKEEWETLLSYELDLIASGQETEEDYKICSSCADSLNRIESDNKEIVKDLYEEIDQDMHRIIRVKNRFLLQRVFKRAIASAACFLLLFTMTPVASEFGVGWKDGLYKVVVRQKDITNPPNLEDIGQPAWIPEGFHLVDQYVEDTDNKNYYYYMYKGDDSKKGFQIQILLPQLDSNLMIEIQDNEPLEVFYEKGITYKLGRNMKQNIIFWYDQGLWYYISGNISKENLKKIALSYE